MPPKYKLFLVFGLIAIAAILAAIFSYDRALDAKLNFYEDLSGLKDKSKYAPGWIDSISGEYNVILAVQTKPEEFENVVAELVYKYGGKIKCKLNALNSFCVAELSTKAAAKMSQDEKVSHVSATRVIPYDRTSQPPPYLRPID